MSNASYLLTVDSALPEASASPSAVTLRIGFGMVPPLWLACFRNGDLVAVDVPLIRADGAETTLTLEMLWTTRAQASSNLREFLRGMQSCPTAIADAGPAGAALLAALDTSRGGHVQLHDVEMQLMVGPENNRPWISACLEYVGDVAQGRLQGDDILRAPQALELFDQAQVQVPDWSCELEWEAALIGTTG